MYKYPTMSLIGETKEINPTNKHRHTETIECNCSFEIRDKLRERVEELFEHRKTLKLVVKVSETWSSFVRHRGTLIFITEALVEEISQ